ncbi:unnamed protein product [Bursaphelenchus okinawaensis]|uniref:Integrase catalytic domain-containing protein n=1 Tax=Bursaphelenchus okinawaensis TaxID=465554 RepID=A0A811LDK5_9BILA|nr:unnamed protein product [Bursaphelenchus okinawaensis]CAG9122279.1 unnamed protein product [Bursaphelenchus okinawaensis]
MAKAVKKAFGTIDKAVLWSDSMIALQQISKEAISSQPVFVRNRITEIQKQLDWIELRHVKGTENPADCATRGFESLDEFKQHSLWWNGPEWLSKPQEWPSNLVVPIQSQPEPEEPVPVANALVTVNEGLLERVRTAQTECPPTTKQMKRFRIQKDSDGLLCVPNRLLNSEWSGAPYSWWLPSNHEITKQLADETHQRLLHCGPATLFAELRTQFFVKYTVAAHTAQRCSNCRVFDAKPYANPPWAPLPVDRVNPNRPFESVGVDFAGPFHTESGELYVMIFACASTRAIHCECTQSMTTEDVLMAFDRFEARRGIPDRVRSDNAESFKLAAKVLQGRSDAIRWTFITPRGPWKGALWERLIQPLKRSVKRIVGRNKLPFRQLEALVIRAEAVVSHRPLFSPEANAAILRPIDFLLPAGVKGTSPTFDDTVEEEWVAHDRLEQRLQRLKGYQEKLLNRFWQLWRKEYLQSIATNEHYATNAANQQTTPVVNETVLIFEELQPRSVWKIGQIVRCDPDRDDVHRVATVRLQDGKELQRPIPLLYPLELRADPRKDTADDTSSGHSESSDGPELQTTAEEINPRSTTVGASAPAVEQTTPPTVKKRGKRVAHQRATSRLKQWAALLAVFVTITCTAAQRPYVCEGNGKTIMWTPPPLLKTCHTIDPTVHREAQAVIYESNRATFKTEGYRCRLKHARVELWTDSTGHMHSEEFQVSPEVPLDPKECKKMHEDKTCRYGKLSRIGPVWRTNDVIADKNFPNRFSSILSSTTVETKNCYLDNLNLYATHRNNTPYCADVTLDGCRYDQGHCKVTDGVVVNWDPIPEQAEECTNTGSTHGFTDGVSFTDTLGQRRWTFTDRKIKIKGQSAIITHQGHALMINSKKGKRSLGEERAVHSQFYEHLEFERSKKIIEQLCNLAEKVNNLASSLDDLNPVPRLQREFNTTALKTVKIDQGLYEVQVCSEIPDLQFTPTTECQSFPTVTSSLLSNDSAWVLDPQTLEVTEHVEGHDRCAEKVILRIDGEFKVLDYLTGELSRYNLQRPVSQATDVLGSEEIIRSWEYDQHDQIMRQILDDMHRANEVRRSLGPVKRTAKPLKLKEITETPLIPWWLWTCLTIFWQVVVNLVIIANLVQALRWAVKATEPEVHKETAHVPPPTTQPTRATSERPTEEYWLTPARS